MDKILYPAQLEYLASLRPQPDELVKSMEEFAANNRVPVLDWKSIEFVEQLVMISRPERVLEIGTAIAYSSIRIARRLRKRSRLYTIEFSADNIKLAKENIRKADLQDKIRLVEGNALEVMPQFKKKFDLIFLDADKEDYLNLLDLSVPLLKKRGIIVVDNLLWHGFAADVTVPDKLKKSSEHIREFNKKFVSHPELYTSILPVGDGIGLGVKKTRKELKRDLNPFT